MSGSSNGRPAGNRTVVAAAGLNIAAMLVVGVLLFLTLRSQDETSVLLDRQGASLQALSGELRSTNRILSGDTEPAGPEDPSRID